MPIQLPEWTLRVAESYDQSRNTKYLLGDKPDPSAGDERPFYSWPDTFVFYMTTDNTVAIKNNGVPTPLTLAMQRAPIAMMQGGDFFTASQRVGSVPFWTQFHADSVPGQHLINHRFAKSTKGVWPVGDASQGQIAWDAIFKAKIPNAHLTRGSGAWIGSENNPAYWLINYAPEPQGAGKYFADRHIEIHDDLVANIGPYLHIYYDGFPNLETDRRANELHGGGNHGPNQIISIPGTGIVRLPYWNIDLTGLPDVGDGFFDVRSLFDGFWPSFRYIKLAFDMTGGNSVTGVRHNGTSSTDVRWNTSQNDPANYPSAGDTFAIMNQDRVGYDQDFGTVGSPGSPPDGIDESRAVAAEAAVRENAKLDFMHYQSDAMFARWGYRGWVCCNGLSTSADLKYRQINASVADDPSYGRYDWFSGESFNNAYRFDQWDGAGFNVKLTDIDKILFALYYGKECLDLSIFDVDTQVNRSQRCPYPFIIPAVEAGEPEHVTSSNDWSAWEYYSDPANPESRVMAAFARFWRGLTKSMSHCFMSLSGGANSSEPWWAEDMFHFLGLPEDDSTRELGTFDRNIAGPSAFQWRTPDFGTRGYVTTFVDPVTGVRSGALAINCEQPTLANGGAVEANGGVDHYWTPSYGASGTAVNLNDYAPPGKVAVNFDSATYITPSAGAGDPRDGYIPGQDQYCAKDPLWNNGQETGIQLLGPWEVRAVLYV